MGERRGQHLALYGNVSLPRQFCERCKAYAFVIDGLIQCCDRDVELKLKRVRRMSNPEQRRKQPKKSARQAVIAAQGNLCLYCDLEFGSVVYRRGKPVKLKRHWDHVVPYSYSQNNCPENVVAACHVCNLIKSDLVFETLEQAKEHITSRRWEKGISLV